MAEGCVAATRAARRRPPPWATRTGHAAFAWALLFAAAHVYWAFGGSVLLVEVPDPSPGVLFARDPWSYTIGWALLSLLFVFAGLFPLALVWPDGGRIGWGAVQTGVVSLGYAGMVLLTLFGLATQKIGLAVFGSGVCVLGGIVTLVRPHGARAAAWTVLAATWGLGVAMSVYGCGYLLAAIGEVNSQLFIVYLITGGASWLVGGGYSGVEAFAELEDMARYTLRFYPGLLPSDMKWVLVEATGRILPEVGESLGEYTVERLRERGMEVRLDTTVESMVGGHIILSDGEKLDAGTVVWTAGVRANPLAIRSGLPVDHTGRLVCSPDLRIKGVPDAWSAGDTAAVPDLSKDEPSATCAPSAQHAVRQAKRLADNVVAVMRGGKPKAYVHADVGSVASLGLYKGVAEVYGVRLKGFLAWFMHRGYHLSRVPTLGHKARVAADWTTALLFGREVVSLGQVEHPRQEWESAALAQASGPRPVQTPRARVGKEGARRHG